MGLAHVPINAEASFPLVPSTPSVWWSDKKRRLRKSSQGRKWKNAAFGPWTRLRRLVKWKAKNFEVSRCGRGFDDGIVAYVSQTLSQFNLTSQFTTTIR